MIFNPLKYIMNDKSYITWQNSSDTALSKTIGDFVNYHRLKQNKTQQEVAKNAGISRSTLSLLEKGETVTVTTLLRVLRVLDVLHIMDIFKIEQQISPIEQAKLDKQKRQRARTKKESEQPESEW